ncbi:MAG: hypothetical protein PF484_06460 [Bacteroidales bacterium]|nr:hypothetical protein [Bacteroidales bacterium]
MTKMMFLAKTQRRKVVFHNIEVSNILLLLLLFATLSTFAQSKFTIDGRVEGMPVFWKLQGEDLSAIGMDAEKLYSYSSLNNRLNLNWYASDKIHFQMGVRTSYVFGDLVYEINSKLDGLYNNMNTEDPGWMNLTHAWHEDNNGVLFSNIDRLFFQYNGEKVSLTIGRQRINWGINMVWQPNDIFNSFNYLDFNYPERPGSDAVRFQYFTGMTSSLELAYKIDGKDQSTFAAKYAFNQWNYDFQFMGGMMNDEYWVGGFGFSGNIGGAGFNGEASYYFPKSDIPNLNEALIASLGANYMFKNSLFINVGGLLNSAGSTEKVSRSMFTMMENISALDYTQSMAALFASASYPITPLINLDFSGMMNPFDGSFYIGPSLNFSLSDNVSLYFIAQTFWGEEGSEYGDIGQMYFSRLQWNF